MKDGIFLETRVDLSEIEVLTTIDELITAAIPSHTQTGPAAILDVAANPINPAQLFIALTLGEGEDDQSTYILLYDDEQDALTLTMELAFNLIKDNPLQFSPDGQWLTLQSYDSYQFLWQLNLHNNLTGEVHTVTSNHLTSFPGYDWSADGQWLIRVGRWVSAIMGAWPRFSAANRIRS